MTSSDPYAADPQLACSITQTDGTLTLAVAGEIDLATTPQLTDAIERAVFSIAPPQNFVVDLAEVSFMDSTGAHILVETENRLSDLGISLRIRGATTSTLRLLHLTGVDALLNLTDSRSGEPQRYA